MSEAEYTINHDIDGWPICKNGEPIFDNKTMLAELHSLQARAKELEAINLGLTKTLVEMEAEKAALVEALEKIDAMPHYDDPLRFGCNKSLHDRYELMLQTASEALAAHRKQGGK